MYVGTQNRTIDVCRKSDEEAHLLADCEEERDAAICFDLNRMFRSISCRRLNSFSLLNSKETSLPCQLPEDTSKEQAIAFYIHHIPYTLN
jgi:hypothetical protein